MKYRNLEIGEIRQEYDEMKPRAWEVWQRIPIGEIGRPITQGSLLWGQFRRPIEEPVPRITIRICRDPKGCACLVWLPTESDGEPDNLPVCCAKGPCKKAERVVVLRAGEQQ